MRRMQALGDVQKKSNFFYMFSRYAKKPAMTDLPPKCQQGEHHWLEVAYFGYPPDAAYLACAHCKAVKPATPSDPMERIIAAALDDARIAYVTGCGGNPSGLDFLLTDSGIEIEVKRFHSERIAGQMARADNVIVAQGEPAVQFLARALRGLGEG